MAGHLGGPRFTLKLETFSQPKPRSNDLAMIVVTRITLARSYPESL